MATCARSHGGDGGGRPPRRHFTRLDHGCKSSQPKKVRGRGKNKNLDDLFNSRGKVKIPLELDPNGTYRFVGSIGQMFIRCLSNELWRVPLYHDGWEHVDEIDKFRVYKQADHYFDLKSWIDSEVWDKIRPGIEDDCGRRYKDHRAELKRHFDKVGGYDDIENARKHHHPYITQEAWKEVIDKLFLDEKYRRRSERNKANRQKQLYPNRCGSRSFASWRHEEVQTIGRTRLIDMWREMHFHPVNGWVNEKAEEDWDRIELERARMQEEAGDEPIDEEKCLKTVLGERSGWVRGIGRKVRNTRVDVSCIYNHASQEEYNALKENVSQLNEHFESLTAKIKELEKGGSSSQAQDEDEDEDANLN